MSSHRFLTRFGPASVIIDAAEVGPSVDFHVRIMSVAVAVPLDPNEAEVMGRDLIEAARLVRARIHAAR